MKRLTILFTLLVFVGLQLFSQARVITGTITSAEDGSTLPGVSVVVRGTTIGTITDVDGNYSLAVPDDAIKLMFTYVGMKTVEETIEGRSVIDVILEQDVFGLDEVVVTGYATQIKEALTGAVATISADELVEVPATNIAHTLQGRASGVTILNSHVPGGDVTVRVRGLGTINNNDPLWVIDGVPTKWGLNQLNPNDIESVSVLKDAASQAIYGARGANGVIIITTKRGRPGEPKINFSLRTGVTQATNKYDLLNTQEYGELLWLEAGFDGVPPGNALYGYGASPDIPDYIYPARALPGSPEVDPAIYSFPDNLIMQVSREGTDWYDEIYQTAGIQDYNLSVSGGTIKSNYAISGGYMKEEGILIHTGFERYSLRSNLGAKFKDWLEIGESLGVTYTKGFGNRGDNSEGTVISQAYRMQPIIPVYDIMGNFAGTKAPSTGNGSNPVADLTRDKNDFGRDLRAIGNIFGQAQIIEGLKFKSLFGFDYRLGNWKNIFIKNPEFGEAKPADILSEGNNYTIQWNWANTLNYNISFADIHNVNVLVGSEAVSNSYLYFDASRSTYFSISPDYMFLDSGEADQMNSGLGSDWKTFSYFGRLNYNFAGKYLLEATIRRDGSSRFGANERWGIFPAFSAGWRVTSEDFMAGTQNWLDFLKLRVGWGQAGNDEVGNYNGFTTFRSNNVNSYYSITGANTTVAAGFDSNAYGNPDAKWETTQTSNVGLDATFLNNSLSFSFDVWQRNTTDMLYAIAVPSVVGQASTPSVNIGDMKNNGIDATLIYKGAALAGDFTYNVGINFSHYKNEIVKISDNVDEVIFGGDFRQMVYTRAEVGTSFPEFYGYVVEGIFQTEEEADAHPPAFGSDGTYNAPGHFKYKDVNGDGVIDADDRDYMGSPHPDFTAGLTIDLGYKGFDLAAFFYTSYGNEMVNYVARWIDYTQFSGNRSHDRLYNSWGSPYLSNNEDAILAKADTDQGSQEPSSHFIQNASFLRLKNLQIGYTLPNSLMSRLGMSSLRIYLQGTNLFTLTEYDGLDPEVRTGGSNMGIDAGAWPTARQLMIGVNIGF
ncbi:MAG: TonB-dependent receptor [Bacteroidales bacterium]|nr:TonB-dependent receptor [Bacteroidales bacterium]